MRIVLVSAHYPPDFVSGGTLVPQRQAQQLATRGHDVSVFAGHLHAESLAAWDEMVDDIPVHWVGNRDFTDWRLETQYNHPAIDEIFARYLARVRPDIVHLHSLQTLGAGLLHQAKVAGAQVVVTMHDFWWVCARQFLVDPTGRPCGVNVTANACACARSHHWLEQRNAFLVERLSDADLILAPSRAMANALIANGIDETRLRVDENGLPDAPVSSREHTSSDQVRFLFAGGPDPMKGWPVLQTALGLLGDVPGWSLSAYGVKSPNHSALKRAAPFVHGRAPYQPSELSDVFSQHEVLVLPSLALESYSIITREALAAGLAVVCSNTLGPEEVVKHDVNGLVVPIGDAKTLAAALRRIVEEPGLLARLRTAAITDKPAVRSLDDQIDGLEALYTELLQRTAPSQPIDEPIRRVLFVVGIDGAPLRYRAHLAAEGLRLLGVHCDVVHYRDYRITKLGTEADAVVFYRVPATIQTNGFAATLRDREPAIPLLFDIDDLIFDDRLDGQVHGLAALSTEELELYWQGVRRYRTTMQQCDAYIGSTETLCDYVTEHVGLPAYRWANGVGVLLGQLSDVAGRRARTPGPIRLGYFSGTNTHDADWAACEPAVAAVLRSRPDVELWIGGYLQVGPTLDPFAARIRRLPFLPWQELPDRLHDLDINLAPLHADNIFNEAKSAIKWLEAAIVATPTIATPTQPFREAIEDGVTGILANTPEQWQQAIERLLDDEALRTSIGAQARRIAELRLGPQLQAHRYLAILEEVRQRVRDPATRRPAVLEPNSTQLDEPLIDVSLAPYEATISVFDAAGHGGHPRTLALLRRYLHSGWLVWRQQGIRGFISGVGRVLRKVVRRLRRKIRAVARKLRNG
jgi:glycosyltransferase involved in cell wall biosynthesis